MKVKDLIKELEKMNPEAEVIISSSNFELRNAFISDFHVTKYETGLKKKESFRDAFDGEEYKKEVWNLSGGSESIILIS